MWWSLILLQSSPQSCRLNDSLLMGCKQTNSQLSSPKAWRPEHTEPDLRDRPRSQTSASKSEGWVWSLFLEAILDAFRCCCSGYQPNWKEKPHVLPKANSNKSHMAGEDEQHLNNAGKKREATKPRWSEAPIWKADGQAWILAGCLRISGSDEWCLFFQTLRPN